VAGGGGWGRHLVRKKGWGGYGRLCPRRRQDEGEVTGVGRDRVESRRERRGHGGRRREGGGEEVSVCTVPRRPREEGRWKGGGRCSRGGVLRRAPARGEGRGGAEGWVGLKNWAPGGERWTRTPWAEGYEERIGVTRGGGEGREGQGGVAGRGGDDLRGIWGRRRSGTLGVGGSGGWDGEEAWGRGFAWGARYGAGGGRRGAGGGVMWWGGGGGKAWCGVGGMGGGWDGRAKAEVGCGPRAG